MARPLAVGMWVRFFRDFDVNAMMIGVIERNEVGRIASIDHEGVWVALRRHHPLLDGWDNQVQLYDYRPDDPSWAGCWIEPAQPSS